MTKITTTLRIRILHQSLALCLCLMFAGGWCTAQTDAARLFQNNEAAEVVRLIEQIDKLREEGKETETIPLTERLVKLTEKLFGPSHLTYAMALNDLAELYKDQRNYEKAEPLFKQALKIREDAPGSNHLLVATSLNGLALLYRAKGDHALAEPLLQRALSIREKELGPDHPDLATSLNNLGALYSDNGNYALAEPLYQRALSIREKALGPNHPYVANSLGNLGMLYKMKGDFARAEPLLHRALSIDEKAFGPNHPNVAIDLNNQAGLYDDKGDYVRVEKLLLRALSIYETSLNPNDPTLAKFLNNLAGVYFGRSELVKAEPLFRRSLAIREKAFGPDHPEVAVSLDNLAMLYKKKGEYDRAEELFQRALSIEEKVFGPNHPSVAISLGNLGALYKDKREYGRAEPLHQRALSIKEKVFGPDHPSVAISLNNLAGLFLNQGDYARAEPLYQRALTIREKALGPDHPTVARSLNDLAVLRIAQRDYTQAEVLLQRVLSIEEKALGPDHPDVGATFSNLSALYEAVGNHVRSVDFQFRSQEIDERVLSLILTTGSEHQKLLYLTSLNAATYSTVSLHTRSAPTNSKALQLALTTILQRKGRVLDAMTDQIASLRRRLDPQARELLDQIFSAKSELSARVLRGRGNKSPDEHKFVVSQLKSKIEQLEDTIAKQSAEFKQQMQPVTIEQVQNALPPGAALVEFFSYQPYDPKAKTPKERFGPMRYVVYILRDKGEPLWSDLGETKGVDTAISRLQVALRCPQTVNDIKECPAVPEVKRLAHMVDERVMRPVRRLLGDTRQLFVSPDAALNLLPFAALVDEQGKYLMERYSLTYLTSGRDLLRLQVVSESREPPLVVADPAFGTIGQATSSGRGMKSAPARRSDEMIEVNFRPLPGTAAEARTLAALLPGARILTQAQASEAAFGKMSGPSVLHVATHGFFLPDQSAEISEDVSNLSGRSSGPRVVIRSENPLLASGLALAGANLPPPTSDSDDGILMAFETAGLDLWGTKLVVLSACETGIGALQNGEGVYGLRRALVLAGSQSQVMSLWQVSDEATSHLMVHYYKRLLTGEGRSEALRQVQLEMIQSEKRLKNRRLTRRRSPAAKVQSDYSHPYYWAGFIQSGDWRAMNFQSASRSPGQW